MIIIILIIILFLFLCLLKLKQNQEYFETTDFKLELYDKFYQINGYNGSLFEITIPHTIYNINITRIKNGAFNYYGFRKVDFTGSKITSIGDSAFLNCIELTSVILPDTLNTIGNDVFKGCSKLSSITFNGIKPTIGTNAFYNIANNVNVNVHIFSWSDNDKNNFKTYSNKTINFIDLNYFKLSSDGSTINGYSGTSDTIIIPLKINGINITEIGDNAFKHKSIKYLYWGDLNNIGTNVKTIGNYAFINCINLLDLTIPNNITTIGSFAFFNCSSLSYIYISKDVTDIKPDAFTLCTELTKITFEGRYPVIIFGIFNNISNKLTINHHSWTKENIDDFKNKNFYNKFDFVNLDENKNLLGNVLGVAVGLVVGAVAGPLAGSISGGIAGGIAGGIVAGLAAGTATSTLTNIVIDNQNPKPSYQDIVISTSTSTTTKYNSPIAPNLSEADGTDTPDKVNVSDEINEPIKTNPPYIYDEPPIASTTTN